MKENNQVTENLETPSRWRRFFAYLLDLVINFLILIFYYFILFNKDCDIYIFIMIILIANLMFFIYYKTTIWNRLVWIFALNKNGKSISWWKSILRYFVFNPPFLQLIFFIVSYLSLAIKMMYISAKDRYDVDVYPIKMWMLWFTVLGLVLLLINIIELFFKCPTFIDKRLWIKRVHKKSE